MDAFSTAAHDTAETALQKKVMHAGPKLIPTTIAIGICLTATLGDKPSYPQDLIDCIDPDLYERAKKLTPTVSENFHSFFSDKILKTLTPERAWPLMLIDALCIKQGYPQDGTIPGYNMSIFQMPQHGFPPEYEEARMDFFWQTIVHLHPYTKVACEKLQNHLNYPYEIDPYWVPPVVGAVKADMYEKGNVCFSNDLNIWFPRYFHATRAQSGTNDHKINYN